MTIFAYYAALHLAFLKLHHALALRNMAQFNQSEHKGMGKCP